MKKYNVIFSDLDGTLINTISGETFPKGIWDMQIRFEVLDYHDTQKHIVLMKLHLLRDEYRNGWLPDWKEQSVKHTILIDHDDIVVGKSYVISCFLAFQTEELAEEFLNNFRELIVEAGDLI